MAKSLANCPILSNIDILLPFGVAVLRKLGLLGPGEEPTREQIILLEAAAEEADRENEAAFRKLKEASKT